MKNLKKENGEASLDIYNEIIYKKELEKNKKVSLPMEEWDITLEHDKAYLEILQNEVKYKKIKIDANTTLLQKKLQDNEPNRNSNRLNKTIDLDFLLEDTLLRKSLIEAMSQFLTLQTLLDDKIMHYENVFLPQYKLELKECKNEFKKTLTTAKKIVEDIEKNDIFTEVRKKINFELNLFYSFDLKDQQNEERELNLYKPLKRLILTYENLKNDI